MRADANKIALRAIRQLLASANPFDIQVGTTKVTCSVTPLLQETWPSAAGGLDPADDGPWPRGVTVDARWIEGKCRLVVEAYRWPTGIYLDDLCIDVRT